MYINIILNKAFKAPKNPCSCITELDKRKSLLAYPKLNSQLNAYFFKKKNIELIQTSG